MDISTLSISRPVQIMMQENADLFLLLLAGKIERFQSCPIEKLKNRQETFSDAACVFREQNSRAHYEEDQNIRRQYYRKFSTWFRKI